MTISAHALKGGVVTEGAATTMGTSGDLTFPPGFIWGTATAAYQIEGGASRTEKGSRSGTGLPAPGKIADGKEGRVACDHYRLFASDFDLMKALGLGNYRFSISWPRVIPDGSGSVNRFAVEDATTP